MKSGNKWLEKLKNYKDKDFRIEDETMENILKDITKVPVKRFISVAPGKVSGKKPGKMENPLEVYGKEFKY